MSRVISDLIRSFRHKGLKRLYAGDARSVHAMLRSKVENILAVLDAARSVEDVNLPGFRLHELKGKDAGVWSVVVNKNWRVTFRFADDGAHDVDLVDYH